MLVLSRKLNEAVVIGDGILVRVIKIRGGHVRLAIDAPPQVSVDREEVRRRKEREGGHDMAVLADRRRVGNPLTEPPLHVGGGTIVR